MRPPLLILQERRAEYIDLLWTYENTIGVIQRSDRLLPPHPSLTAFKALLRKEWKESIRLVEDAKQQAARRTA